MTPVLIVAIIAWGIYSLFELFAHRKERLNIIDKLDFSKNDKDINMNIFFNAKAYMGNNALRIGMLLIGVGLGLLVGFMIYLCNMESIHKLVGNDNYWGLSEIKTVVYGSCVLLFGGAGLLSAYIVEHKQKNKAGK